MAVDEPLNIVYGCTRQDEIFLEEIEKHLNPLVRQSMITTWHEREIDPGAKLADVIDIHIETANIILLLVSPDFFSSDNCNTTMKKALDKRKTERTYVIPILLRPVDYKNTPLSDLQMLPREGLAISRWPDRDDAYVNVAQDIRKLVESLLQKSKAGRIEYNNNVIEESLVGCEEKLRQDPGNSFLLVHRGDILFQQRRFAEAFSAYTEAIKLEPNYKNGYLGKARVYEQFAQQNREQARVYEQLAQQSYEQAKSASTKNRQGENKQ